jgi:GTP cyclohydrolase I
MSLDNEEKNISEVIRGRLKQQGKRFFACDNISEFLTDYERERLVDELTDKFNDVLHALIIDTENDPNSRNTGKRLAKMYVNEIMSGRYYPAPESTAFPNDDNDRYTGMLVVRAELKSLCSHHHQPVRGIAYIGIIPGQKVIGLSKYARIAQWHARRGTLQEELCNHIAGSIMSATESDDVAVYIAARHGCCENRGIQATSSLTQTTVLHGQFHEASVKKEFFDNIALQQSYGEKL